MSKAIKKLAAIYPSEDVKQSSVSIAAVYDVDNRLQIAWLHHGPSRLFVLYAGGKYDTLTFADADAGRVVKIFRCPAAGEQKTEVIGDITLTIKCQDDDVEIKC